MKSEFDNDLLTKLRTASLVFKMEDGELLMIDAKPGEDAGNALQRCIFTKTRQNCQIQIIGPNIYKAIYPDGLEKTFLAII